MKRLRFNLRLFLLLVTALVLFLGYSQVRKQKILEMCAALREDGYAFSVPSAWHDVVWQRKPTVARVYEDHGQKKMEVIVFQSAATIWGDAEATKDTIQWLEELGVVEYTTESSSSLLRQSE